MSYVQNYGFTKTLIKDDNDNTIHNELKWLGDYDGKIANIDVDINTNGNKEFVSMQLNNNDLRQIFGIQPVETSLDRRLFNDYYNPVALEGALFEGKSRRRRHRKKPYKKRKTRRNCPCQCQRSYCRICRRCNRL